jgi:hypothetical protein
MTGEMSFSSNSCGISKLTETGVYIAVSLDEQFTKKRKVSI